MKERKSRKEYLKYVFIVFLGIFVVSAALLCLGLWEKSQTEYISGSVQLGDILEYDGKEYSKNKNIETFLILGLDKHEQTTTESYNNEMRADFLMLFVLDNDAKTCTAVHINRDTMTAVKKLTVTGTTESTAVKQIALAHEEGNGKESSCQNTADAVSGLFMGMRIDNYMSVTMDVVPFFNDLVGGVTVTVLDDFSGIDDTLVKGETVTLMGEHALKYVRTRKDLDDSSNSARMARQKQYLEALHKKTAEAFSSDEDFFAKIFGDEESLEEAEDIAKFLDENIVSNCTDKRLQIIAEKIGEYEFKGIRYVDGENKVGNEFMEFYPEEDSVRKIVVDLFYEPKK